MKKFSSLIILISLFFSIFMPSVSAAIYKSDLNEYAYKRSDEADLRNYVPQEIKKMKYINWFTGKMKIFRNWKPSYNVNGFYNFVYPHISTNDWSSNFGYSIPFHVIVNPFYYDFDSDFFLEVPFARLGVNSWKYLYMRILSDRDEYNNICLYAEFPYFDEKMRLETTCKQEFESQKPFILFFNISLRGIADSNDNSYLWYSWPKYEWYIKVTYTSTYETSLNEEVVYRAYNPKVFIIYFSKFNHPFYYSFYTLFDASKRTFSFLSSLGSDSYYHWIWYWVEFHQVTSKRFLRPITYLWDNLFSEQFYKKFNVLTQDCRNFSFEEMKKVLESWRKCDQFQVAYGVDDTNYLDWYVPAVLESIYWPPILWPVFDNVSDDVIIDTDIDDDWLLPVFDLTKPIKPTCELWVTTVGCWFSYIGYYFSNLIYAFQLMYNWFAKSINFIFSFVKSLFTTWSSFYNNFLIPAWDYIRSFYEPFYKIFNWETDLSTFFWGDQEYMCQKDSNFFIENTTNQWKKPMESLGAFLYFINPIPPAEGSTICTSLGLKKIEYWQSTFIDVLLFNIFVFAGIWFMFIWLRRYS